MWLDQTNQIIFQKNFYIPFSDPHVVHVSANCQRPFCESFKTMCFHQQMFPALKLPMLLLSFMQYTRNKMIDMDFLLFKPIFLYSSCKKDIWLSFYFIDSHIDTSLNTTIITLVSLRFNCYTVLLILRKSLVKICLHL